MDKEKMPFCCGRKRHYRALPARSQRKTVIFARAVDQRRGKWVATGGWERALRFERQPTAINACVCLAPTDKPAQHCLYSLPLGGGGPEPSPVTIEHKWLRDGEAALLALGALHLPESDAGPAPQYPELIYCYLEITL